LHSIGNVDVNEAKCVHDRIDSILATTERPFRVRGCDGAYGNDKLIAHEQGIRKESIVSSLTCQNHTNALIETSCTAVIGADLQANMYCFTSLLRMSGTFARMLGAVRLTIKERLDVRSGIPPAASKHYLSELMKYAVANHRRFVKATAEHRESTQREVRPDTSSVLYQRKWDNFAKMWNGLDCSRNDFVHFCTGRSCCRDLDITIDKMAKTMISLWLTSLPVVPESGKWTLLGPCVDWHLLGFALHSCVRHIARTAFATLSIPMPKPSGEEQ
jgi:hypothetical protein